LLLAGAVALLSFVGAVDLARAVADMGPCVGDVIAFQTDHAAGIDTDARLEVARTDQPGCRLDVATIRQSGGSVVVEQRRSADPRLYQVHWSGPLTSSDGADCGTSADLLLRDTDMEVLAMAAGGYGVEHKQIGLSGSWGSEAVPVR
jgi:hypothetical protein